MAHYLLARAQVAMGRVPEAQAAYRDVLKLAPDFVPARTELALVSGEKPDDKALDQTIERLREALKKDPRNAPTREALARTLLAKGQVKEAEAEYKQILDLAPTYTGANYGMAQLKMAERNADEAASYLRAVLRTNPAHVDANVQLAHYLSVRGQREEAIVLLTAALQANPNLAAAKVQLGRLYAQTGRYREAQTLASDLEKVAPKSPFPQMLAGSAHLGQREFKKAQAAFGEAIRRQDNLAEAYRGLAQALDGLGQPERAIEMYRRALAIHANDPVALNNLAWLLTEVKKRPDEALPLATKAEQLAPRSPEVLDTLGWVHYRRGDFALAQKALQRAAEQAPGHAAIQYHLGMVYSRLGHRDQAVSALRLAAQADPQLAQREKIPQIIKELGG
jgi:tetratricopeptide (TPR) repeat protein